MSDSDTSAIDDEVAVLVETLTSSTDETGNTGEIGNTGETNSTPVVGLSVNERNRLLIQLDRLKWPGLNLLDLVKATHEVLQDETSVRLLSSKLNQDQILFAKRVWNRCPPKVRRYFLPTETTWMSSVGSDENTIRILTDALDTFEKNVRQGKDDSKYLAYLDILAKYEAAIAKRTLAADNPFVEPLTPGELRLIATFEAKQRERVPRPAEEYEKHYPNQNAVTYPYMLGKMMFVCECHTEENVTTAVRTMDDIFKFLSIHGQKGHSTLYKQVMKWASINGPTSGVDIKPMLEKLLLCESYQVASGKSASNKYLENHFLTLKRMIRVVYICSKHPTPWGMLNQNNADFTTNLKEMHDIETRLEEAEKFSLAMVWYKCINRDNICTIMVDHHEYSANNILAHKIGKQTKGDLTATAYAFPFTKNTKESFGNAELGIQQE